ncbi:lipoxygenase homology domain-containing protein 1-like [Physella acuta]|uniref:lipoxygenase homology domain-containing protein 1-like n=1 Tax=Physella acuta TaxID=109671 RepID=UPI0027DD1D09|nr:lipoxygenase homology domain-containing protein 1-like [Physella acuta]
MSTLWYLLFGLFVTISGHHPTTVQYRVIIQTGHRMSAGTDARIFIDLFGARGNTGRQPLPDHRGKQFERGHRDTFTFHAKNVGKVHSIQIGHDNSGFKPGWFLDYRPGFTTYRFDYFNWIAADEGDRSLVKTISAHRVNVVPIG